MLTARQGITKYKKVLCINLLVFWKPGCAKCPAAKELGKEFEAEGVGVNYLNISEPEGLSEAAMHGIMGTPSLVVVDDSGSEVASWKSEVPEKDDVAKALQ